MLRALWGIINLACLKEIGASFLLPALLELYAPVIYHSFLTKAAFYNRLNCCCNLFL